MSTHNPIQWVPEGLSPGIEWPGCEGDYTLPYNAEVNNEWSHALTSQVFMAWYLIKNKDILTLSLLLQVLGPKKFNSRTTGFTYVAYRLNETEISI
jgi:hypothetical protein